MTDMQETSKRILQVVYSLGVGGSEMVALDIALGLQGRGIDNAVCALERGGPLQEELSRAGVPSFVVGRQGGGTLGSMFRMLRIMLRFKPDVVHTHHLYELYYAWPAALVCGARIVHTEHERFSLAPSKKRMLLRILSRLCAVVTAVDADVAAFLREKVRIPAERVALVPNGVNVERLGNAPSVRESLGISPDRPVLGIVARLEVEKDHQTLFHAFAAAVKRVPSALLLVIGDGSMRQELKQLAEQLAIQDSVLFLGMRRDIPEIMNSLDLVVLSSRAEGLPLSILEAMAAGKPVVATRVGGLPNVVRDGETGLLVPPGNAPAMAEAIARLLTDSSLGKRCGELGRQIVAGQYSTRQSLDRYIRLYSDQTTEPGGAAMCGIWGLKDNSISASLRMEMASRSIDVLKHRGPDDFGAWHDDDHGLSLTHRRLAILDLSEHGHQPMFSASGRYCMVFNGEVYNFERLRKQLRNEGHSPQFRGTSDTEVMLACFDAWGVAQAVRQFIGMFAFGVWDLQEHQLWLARDPMGIKPLYYIAQGHRLAFSSELKGLTFFSDQHLQLDTEAITLFLKYGYIPAPHSIFEDIRKLPPGNLLRCDFSQDGRLRAATRTPFWSLYECAKHGIQNPFLGTDDEYIERVNELLSDSTGLCMISDVPVGAFLSGGIDSSCIVSLMRQFTSHKIRTFTIRFDDPAHDESQHARAVANHLGTDHTELLVTQADLLQSIPQLVESFDEPFADTSQIPTYAVSKLAREHVTVILSGDGGDELFCGYPSYKVCSDRWNLATSLPGPVKALLSYGLRHAPDRLFDSTRLLSLLFKSQTSTGSEKIDTFLALLESKNPLEFYDQAIIPYKRYWNLLHAQVDKRMPPAGQAPPAGLSPIASMMFHDTVTFLPDDILVKVDRASMAVALEARVPILDHRIVELAWSLPINAKLRGNTHKFILKELLYKHVPRNIVDRPKHGFTIPLASWLRGPLKDWAHAELFDNTSNSSEVLCKRSIQRLWHEHQASAADRSAILWALIVLTQFIKPHILRG